MSRPTLFAHDSLWIRGGAELALLDVARVAREFSPVTLSLMFEERRVGLSSQELSVFQQVRELGFPRSVRLGTGASYALSLTRLRQAVAGARMAVAVGWGSAFRLAVAGSGTGTPLVWLCVLEPPYHRGALGVLKDRTALALMAAAGMRIVCTCEAARATLLAAGYPAEQLMVIPNGVDLTRVTGTDGARGRARWPDAGSQALRLLCLARLDGNKNQELVIRAVAACKRRGVDVSLACVGGPSPQWPTYPRRLEGLCVELGVSDRVVLPDATDDVAAWLQSADAAILASHSESGVPRALLEAGAAGLPLLGSHAGGIPELIRLGQTGLLFGARDVERCADGIATLASDAGLRKRCGDAAAAAVRGEYALARVQERWRKLFGAAG